MSIYISIPCLDDSEIVNTAVSAVRGAERKDDVSIGVAFMGTKRFYQDTKDYLSRYPQVELGWFDPADNRGVGKGRKNAKSFYDDQKYLLQVDSHTNFEYAWDTTLIDLLEEAKEHTGNDKTLLTAYLGKYSFKGSREVLDRTTRYCFFVDKQDVYDAMGFNLWETFPLAEVVGVRPRLIPSNKFNANFAFGDKSFINDQGLPESCVFYDEEIIQSINLLDSGFSLVFPNTELPITHLYSQRNEGHRTNVGTMYDDVAKEIKSNYLEFINRPENSEKCLKFQEYARCSLKTNRFSAFYIPELYS